MEEVPDNGQAIKSVESIKSLEGIKSVESVKSLEGIKSVENIMKDAKIKKKVGMQSSGSKPKEDTDEILELDSEGDIVSRKQEAAVPAALRPEHKNYFSTRIGDKSDIRGDSRYVTPPTLKTLLGEDGLHCSDDELVKQSLIAWRHH